MDTNSANQVCSMLRVQRLTVESIAVMEGVPDKGPVNADYNSNISRLLEYVTLHGDAVAVALEQRLEMFQEAFLQEFHTQMAKAGLLLEGRLEIGLTEKGEFLLEGGAADLEILRHAVTASALLPSLFRRLHNWP